MDQEKRKLREEKRAVKRAGTRHRRQQLKRLLEQDPEGAAEHEGSPGRYRSDALNGIDRDSTRKRDDRTE